jgi:hypothetical protein
MTIDQLLHEAAPDATHTRLHTERLRGQVLARAVSSHAARGQRLRRTTAGVAVAVATVGLGGIAYATAGVPRFVTSAADSFAKDVGVSESAQLEMVQIVDLTLPDGSRFAAWGGNSAGMSCIGYTDNWNGEDVWNGGTACIDRPNDGEDQYVAWAQAQDGSTYYPVLFGTGAEGATEVRVVGTFAGTGEPVDITLPIDTATDAFSTALPGTNDHPWGRHVKDMAISPSGLSLSFLDVDGTALRTVTGPPA